MKRLLHYAWPLLLLVAAVLAPDVATTITLLVGAVAFAVLILLRNKGLTKIMDELAGLIANRGKLQPTSSTLDRSLLRLHRHLLLLAGLAELVVFLVCVLGDLDITVARNYALLILLALAPLGLEMELAVLVRGRRKRSAESVSTALSYAVEDAYALLAILGLSLVGTLWLDIPPALSALQLLVITCVARPLLSGSTLQRAPHRTDRRWRIFFATFTVYGTFIFFFIRHYLEPRFADLTNPITWQATTVAMVTFIACQAIMLAFNPKAPKVIAYRLAILLTVVLGISYLPFVQDYLMTAGLAAADWVWVIIGSLFYAALCLLQYHTQAHSRQAVLELHRTN
ncbi:MAG: cation-transporting P-type ATPase [Candidatus Saccharibacteria bacterium]|nr:cation-transporting P-type ATPase [Candidatus Saccharibacteria bacterium]